MVRRNHLLVFIRMMEQTSGYEEKRKATNKFYVVRIKNYTKRLMITVNPTYNRLFKSRIVKWMMLCISPQLCQHLASACTVSTSTTSSNIYSESWAVDKSWPRSQVQTVLFLWQLTAKRIRSAEGCYQTGFKQEPILQGAPGLWTTG